MSRFWGLRSRCRILLLWIYDKPRNSWNMKICQREKERERDGQYFLSFPFLWFALNWSNMKSNDLLTRTFHGWSPPGCWIIYWAKSVCCTSETYDDYLKTSPRASFLKALVIHEALGKWENMAVVCTHHILEDEGEGLACMDDVMEQDDVGVLEAF